MLPKVCDDDWWVPTGEAWLMESTLPLTGSNWSQVMQLMLQGSPTEEGQDVEVSCELDKDEVGRYECRGSFRGKID